ncbi:MAG TPA: hypothetical protein VFQ22_10535 [Longimicrobiales bacterium]|nr:hypothetical protein [Longimicrobiales bacterium]
MVIPITTLWLPILLSSVLVFVASFLLHMVLPLHRSDFRGMADEDGAQEALRRHDLAPGDYMLPFARTPEQMRSEEYRRKLERGPAAIVTVLKPSVVLGGLGATLVQWFAFTLLVGVLAAYLAGRTLPAGAEYLEVYRVTGTTAFTAYAMALLQDSIWYGRNWPMTLKWMLDGLVYALLTGGVFGWLWPM